jgi:GxxExxY protein
MSELLCKSESYDIVGVLFEVYNNLGSGFSEIVYKEAIEYQYKKITFLLKGENEYCVNYKDTILSHKFYADFIVNEKKFVH